MIIFVLKDFYKGKILRIKKENEAGELKKYNYDLLELIDSNEKFIILISLDYVCSYTYSKDRTTDQWSESCWGLYWARNDHWY